MAQIYRPVPQMQLCAGKLVPIFCRVPMTEDYVTPKAVVFALAFLFGTFSGRQLGAQGVVDSVRAGSIIKMTFDEGRSEKGRLLETLYGDSEEIVYCRYPQACAIRGRRAASSRSMGDVSRIDLLTRSGFNRGAMIGALLGALWFGALEGGFHSNIGETAVVSIAGGIAGAGVGGVLYSRFSRWELVTFKVPLGQGADPR